MNAGRMMVCSVMLAGMLFGVSSAGVLYNEDFSSYGTDTVLSNGDNLGSGLLRWRRNTVSDTWAVTNTIVSASDQLKTELHPNANGKNVYSYMTEQTDVATLSAGQSTDRSVSLSMQTVPLTENSTGGSLAVGFVESGGVPKADSWGVSLGFAVQFGYVDGGKDFIIRRRGTDGEIDSWNGSVWTDDFTTGLSSYSLDKDYSIVSTQTDTSLTLDIFDGETLLESAETSFADMFDYTEGMRWIAGDFNSEVQPDVPYEFTLNSLESSTIPEPASLGLILLGGGLVMALRSRRNG